MDENLSTSPNFLSSVSLSYGYKFHALSANCFFLAIKSDCHVHPGLVLGQQRVVFGDLGRFSTDVIFNKILQQSFRGAPLI